MPSPIGHALAGLAVGFVAEPSPRSGPVESPRLRSAFLVTAAFLATAPDFDLMFPGFHRSVTHSIGATIFLMIITAAVTGKVTGRVKWRWVWMAGAAHVSHILLDWLGTDRFPPAGLEALWPFSPHFYVSGWNVFPPTERRLLMPGALAINVRAVASEIATMGPIAVLTWWLTRIRRSRGRTSAQDIQRQPSA
jgi:membrane-bound metal-dependent hydrolase YbcI (DUF457 family)